MPGYQLFELLLHVYCVCVTCWVGLGWVGLHLSSHQVIGIFGEWADKGDGTFGGLASGDDDKVIVYMVGVL